MAGIIPTQIFPDFPLPQEESMEYRSALVVGSAIRDLEDGANTVMKRAVEEECGRLQEKHAADTSQFQLKLRGAQAEGARAALVVDKSRMYKGIAITLLVGAIVGLLSIIIVAAVTQIWPIFFAAIPFSIAIAPTSYLTHIFRVRVASLEQTIAAPGSMRAPILQLPVYNPSEDLDLYSTRQRVMTSFVCRTLKELTEVSARFPYDIIIGYALLGRLVEVGERKKSEFYQKCIDIIKLQRKINERQVLFHRKIRDEHSSCTAQLNTWKHREEGAIYREQAALNWDIVQAQNRAYDTANRSSRVRTYQVVDNLSSQWNIAGRQDELSRRSASVARSFATTSDAIDEWQRATSSQLERKYNEACEVLQRRFDSVKRWAAP